MVVRPAAGGPPQVPSRPPCRSRSSPPIEPQLARSGKELPLGEQWAYEPKFDGFRAIAFVDGDEFMIQSRGAKPLGRYFPELALPARPLRASTARS